MEEEEKVRYAVFRGHPPGVWYLIAMVIWEFFSYYGMRALLVLYLSQKLFFTDVQAYSLFGAYASLVFVFPTICGFVADRFIGYKWAVILGGSLIALGHFILALGFAMSLYIGLALLVLGVGMFKTNSISLMGEFYQGDRLHRQSAFNLYYAGGNLGGFFASIGCGYVAIHYGWHYGFILAGLGMVVGLIILLSGIHKFQGKGKSALSEGQHVAAHVSVYVGIVIAVAFVTAVLYYLFAGAVLTVVLALTLIYVVRVTMKAEVNTRHELYLFYALVIGGMIFWSFDSQGSSSITLFLQRNINRVLSWGNFRYQIPTPMYQAINPLVILFAAPAVSWVWQKLGKRKILPSAIFKFSCAFVLLTAGFSLISVGAAQAVSLGKANMGWVVGGLALIGIAEVFIDPVALAFVTRVAPEGTTSVLTATYYLFVGALGNYLAAEIAKFTAVDNAAETLKSYAKGYEGVYQKIALISAIFLCVLILFRVIFRKLSVK